MTAANLRPRVVRNQERYASFPKLHTLDLSKLILCLFSGDSVDGEATLGVVNESEVFASLFNRNDVHKARWVCRVGANFAIDFDQALHNNSLGFTAVESILESGEKHPIRFFYSNILIAH